MKTSREICSREQILFTRVYGVKTNPVSYPVRDKKMRWEVKLK